MTDTHNSPVLGAPAEPDVKPAPPETEELEKEDDGGDTDDPWFVILFNDEVHTFEEVIGQLVKATGCSRPARRSVARSSVWRASGSRGTGTVAAREKTKSPR